MNPKLALVLHAVRSACLAGEKVYSVHDYVVQWRAQRGIQCQHKDAPHKKVFSPKAYAHNLVFRVKKLFGSSIRNVRIGGVCTPCMSMPDLFAVRQLLEGIQQQRTRPGCPHGKKSTYYCRRCGGNGICEHARRRETCMHCDPAGYATKRIRHAIYMGIRKRHQHKDQRTLRYLGVQKFSEVIEHLERKMDRYNSSNPTVRMTMHNTHIDHIKPVRQFTVESAATGHVDARMHHYTNLQPLLIEDNLHKSDQWDEACEQVWREQIIENRAFLEIFNPFTDSMPRQKKTSEKKDKPVTCQKNTKCLKARATIPARAMISFARVRTLLAPESDASDDLGRNILPNQPDVEVLAISLKRIPCTRDAYEKAKAPDKDWVHLQFCVVGVGRPGFSSAPYTATKKKGERDQNTRPLYESSEDGGTVFHPFEKGRTGKDRGARVNVVDDVTVTATLTPGVCLTKFLRDENDCFEPGKLFVGRHAVALPLEQQDIPENSFVLLQVGVTNAEQAVQGRLIKIKRIMPVDNASLIAAYLPRMPKSADEHESAMNRSQETFPALAKSVITPNSRIFSLTPQASAYVSDEEGGAALVNGHDTFYVPASVMQGCVHASNANRARKLLNIALAMGAAKLLVRTVNNDTEVLMERPRNQVLHVYIDVNHLLGLYNVREFDTWPGKESSCLEMAVDEEDNTVTWMNPTKTIVMPSEDEHNIVYEVQLNKKTQDEAREGAKSPRVLSDGCIGDYFPLRVYTAPLGVSLQNKADFTLVMSLQLRPGLRVAGGGGKRKREALEADEEDEE